MVKPFKKLSRSERDVIHLLVVEAATTSGKTHEEIASLFGVSVRSIGRWVSNFLEGGKTALKSGKAKGFPRALTSEEEVELVKSVSKTTPEDHRLSGQLWTREHLCRLAKKLFGKRISLSAMSRLMRRRNMSCQKPLRQAIEKNKAAVKEWKETEFPKILKDARKRRASVYFCDETGVRSDNHGGTTWGKKGKTPAVQKTGKRVSLNVIGASSRRGDFRFMIYEDKMNGKKFVEFLKRLMHKRRRPVVLVTDSLRAHKSAVVQDYLSTMGDKLKIVFLPTYSPELNPQEYGWNVLKGRKVGSARIHGKNDLYKAVRSCLREWQHRPKVVMGFFRSKETLYAA
jgi:transposase